MIIFGGYFLAIAYLSICYLIIQIRCLKPRQIDIFWGPYEFILGKYLWTERTFENVYTDAPINIDGVDHIDYLSTPFLHFVKFIEAACNTSCIETR